MALKSFHAEVLSSVTKSRSCASTSGALYFKTSLFSLRQLTTWHCPQLLLRAVLWLLISCGQQSISPARWAHSSKPTEAECGGRMRQTDGQRTVTQWAVPMKYSETAQKQLVYITRTVINTIYSNRRPIFRTVDVFFPLLPVGISWSWKNYISSWHWQFINSQAGDSAVATSDSTV